MTVVLGVSTVLFLSQRVSAHIYATDHTIGKQVDAALIQLRAYVGISDFIYVYVEPPTKEVDKDKVLLGREWESKEETNAAT
jgi:hypothetical protein